MADRYDDVLKKLQQGAIPEAGDMDKMLSAVEAILKVDLEKKYLEDTILAHADTWEVETDDDINEGCDDDLEKKMKQAAAAYRVKLGINKITDQETLLKILQNNEAACRAYLADVLKSQNEFDLSTITEWVESTPDTAQNGILINDSDDVLTDDAIYELRQYAVAQWVSSVIKNADLDAIHDLADLEPADFKIALRTRFRFPEAQSRFINKDIIMGVIEAQLNERIRKLKPEKAVAAYLDYVANLTEEQILSNEIQELLKLKEDAEFINGLSEKPCKDKPFEKDDIVRTEARHSIRNQLTLRYLNSALNKNEFAADALKEALEETEIKPFITKLQELFPDIKLLDKVVTADKMEELKALLAANLLRQVHHEIKGLAADKLAGLKALDKAKNLEDFKAKIEPLLVEPALKAAVSYLKADDMEALQRVARVRHFELQIADKSRLGAEAHPELTQFFTGLSIQQQRDVLANDTILSHLVNAQSSAALKTCLKTIDPALEHSVSADTLNRLAEENQKKTHLRGIHNAELARVLAKAEPWMVTSLREAQVRVLNQKFNTELTKENYLEIVNNYVDTGMVSHKDAEKFRQAFGIDADGDDLGDAQVLQKINNQTKYNEKVIIKHTAEPTKFLSLLLSLEKTQALTEEEITTLEDAFKNSKNATEFIGAISAKDYLSANQKKQLISDISPAVWRDIKNEFAQKKLTGSLEEVRNTLDEIEGALKKAQKEDESFAKVARAVDFVEDVKKIHIFNPLFASKATEMQEKYVDMERQCDLVEDQLRRNLVELEGHLKSIQGLELTDRDQEVRRKKLCEQLETEIAGIKTQLSSYEKTQEKLKGEILPNIATVIGGTQHAVFNTKGVTSYVVTKDQAKGPITETMKRDEVKATAPVGVTTASVGKGDTLEFILKEKPKPGDVRVFEIAHQTDTIKSAGRFDMEVLSDSKTNPSVMIALTQPPKKVAPPAAGQPEKLVALPGFSDTNREPGAHNVNYYLAAAASLLANMDGPPTQENPIRLDGHNTQELKYLWTALMIIGENDPKMKFGPEAVRLLNPAVSLDSEKGRFFGYSNNSLYNTAFKEVRANMEGSGADKLKNLNRNRFNAVSTKNNEELLVEAGQNLKKELQTAKTKGESTLQQQIEENIKREGPAPR